MRVIYEAMCHVRSILLRFRSRSFFLNNFSGRLADLYKTFVHYFHSPFWASHIESDDALVPYISFFVIYRVVGLRSQSTESCPVNCNIINRPCHSRSCSHVYIIQQTMMGVKTKREVLGRCSSSCMTYNSSGLVTANIYNAWTN